MLGRHWILLAAIIVVGAGLLAMRRGTDDLRPLLYQLAPLAVAYAVPTLNPVKQYFFGIAFAVLLFFLAVEILADVLDALEGWARLRQVLVTSLVLVGLLWEKSPLYWGQINDPMIQKRTRLVEEVYTSLREAQPKHAARIYVTSAGTVNAHVLWYMALKDGFSQWSFGTFDGDDLELHRRQVQSADFVIASEPGNSEVAQNLASTAVQGQTLALLRERPDSVELAAFPTLSESPTSYSRGSARSSAGPPRKGSWGTKDLTRSGGCRSCAGGLGRRAGFKCVTAAVGRAHSSSKLAAISGTR